VSPDGAQWSFDYLYDHSHQQEVSGGTVTTTARVIDGAVLVAAKLHSGREQTFGMSWQWQKKSISTLSRHTCDDGGRRCAAGAA